MQEAIQRYVDPSLDENQHEEAYLEISQAIAVGSLSNDNNKTTSSDSLTLQQLIVLLESSLTSSEDKERNRATLLLAELLGQHTSIKFQPAVVHLLVVFFCRRLSDYPSLVPSLRALYALVAYHHDSFDPKYFDYLDIFQTIFRDIFVQGLAQNIRQRVFELLNLLWDQPEAVAIARGSAEEIMNGILTAFEGEKDPRCLVISMQVIAGMIHGLGDSFVMPHTERTFDCTACYFPITFQPPANDPFGITTEMLTKALHDCLCAHVNLMPHLLPFVCDQLQTTVEQNLTTERAASRIQALSCLLDVCGRYSPSILIDNCLPSSSKSIGESLCTVLYDCATTGGGDLPGEYTLYAISQLGMFISVSASGKYNGAWKTFIEALLTKVTVTIADGGVFSLEGRAALRVAGALASASTSCASTVLSRIVPLLSGPITADFSSIRRSFQESGDNIGSSSRSSSQAPSTHSPAISLLTELISHVGVALSNPLDQASEHSHSCGHNHAQAHVHGDSCSHGHDHSHGGSCTSKGSGNGSCGSKDLKAESLARLCNTLPDLDFTSLGSASPFRDLDKSLFLDLYASFEVLMTTSLITFGRTNYLLAAISGGNSLGLCEVLLCMRGLLVRVDPDILPGVQLESVIEFLTWLSVLEHSLAGSSETSELLTRAVGMLQQSAIAILASLARVRRYSQLLANHCLRPLLHLTQQVESSTEETSSLHLPLLRSLSSDVSLTSIWQLIGRLCRTSLENGDVDASVVATVSSESEASLEIQPRKRSRDAAVISDDADITVDGVKKHLSIAGLCLPHLLQAALAQSQFDTTHELKSTNAVSIATIDALLHLLPIERGALTESKPYSLTASEELVCAYLLGNMQTASGSPLVRLALSACDGVSSKYQTVCTILRRVIGNLELSRQNDAVFNLSKCIFQSTCEQDTGAVKRSQLIALVGSAFVYLSPRAPLFADPSDGNINLLVDCLNLTIQSLGDISAPSNPEVELLADHFLSLLLNKLPSGSFLNSWIHSSLNTVLKTINLRMGHVAQSVYLGVESPNKFGVKENCLKALNATIESLLWLAKGILVRSDIKYAEPSQGFEICTVVACVEGISWQERIGRLVIQLTQSPEAISTMSHSSEIVASIVLQLVQSSTANSIQVLLQSHSLMYSAHCATCQNYSPFWRQRLWSRIFPILSAHLQAYRGETALSLVRHGDAIASLIAACTFAVDLPEEIVADDSRDLTSWMVLSLSLCAQAGENNREPQMVATAAISHQSTDATEFTHTFVNTNCDSSPVVTLRKRCLEAVIARMTTSLEEFANHVNTIIPVLIEIVQTEERAAVRSAAIRCLDVLSQLPYSTLHPYKKKVLASLGKALDDKKRFIRLLAGNVRNKWYVLK